MEESLKETSAVGSKSKENGSLLDEEIGKDFLSSWKSVPDDPMDFSFGTISKGKKKEFNFDKLDMDFNLDGDFDKLSSFKMDMPNVDFSSPSKNTANAKEKSKEESTTGKQQGKRDRFTFSFDFDELDGFDFDSSPKKGEKTHKKSQESKVAALESSEFSKVDQALEDDCISAKLPVSKDVANSKAETSKVSKDVTNSKAETSKVSKDVTNSKAETSKVSKDVTNSKAETSKGGVATCDSIDDSCPSNAVPIQGFVPGNLVAGQGSRISPERTVDLNGKEAYKPTPSSDKAVSSELYDQQSLRSSSMDSLSGNNSNQEAVSDMQAEVCSQGRRINTSLATEKKANDKMISNEAIHEKLHWKNSFPLSEGDRDDRKGAADDNVPAELDDSRSLQGDILLKDNIATASLSRELLDNSGTKKDIQNPIPELPLVSPNREPTRSEATAITDREAGAIRSRFFRRTEETKSQLHQPSSTGNKISSFSSKKIGDMHLCPANEKREDVDGTEAQNGRKLVDYSKLSSQELMKGRPVLLQSEDNVGSPSDIRDGFDADAEQTYGSKLIGKSSVQDKTAIGVPVLSRTEKNASLPANPPKCAEKTNEAGIQMPVNPKSQIPKITTIQNSNILLETHKIAEKAPALSSYKSTRTIGPNKDQLNSQRETNSLRNLEQNKDTQGNNTSKIVLPVGNAEKHTAKIPSRKRKSLEESNGALMLLKPLKRLSRSPSESSNLEESSEAVICKEVQYHKKDMEVSTKDIVRDHLTSASEVPQQVNVTELEFPWVMENDGNAEKAEAYGKALDDICNMLKKKNEEAKDLLVRAVINNNKLKMLKIDYLIHEEKIRMAQKFAELLISKDIPT